MQKKLHILIAGGGIGGLTAALALLEPVALARRRALAGQAVALGRRLFADRPEALADRWAVWWRAWRKDAAT